jgi:glycosyltransferase involved in cell wall biosynthesis
MRIEIYHGYELSGSGSNEYTRYLARTLVYLGHEVHIICREPSPEKITYISKAYAWNKNGSAKIIFTNNNHHHTCVLHQLPNADVRPVFLTDKQREGNVKSFVSLSNKELAEYHKLNKKPLYVILSKNQIDVLQANHLIYQPVVALEVCEATNTPLIIYPHGSSIEYVIKLDDRYRKLALKAIVECAGLIFGNREVRDRIINLYPEHKTTILSKTKIVGVGVDTTLFVPQKRNKRKQNIHGLINTGGGGGKIPDLTQELYRRLQKMDIKATQDYWNRYNHSLPDEDLSRHLNDIPWNSKILLYVGALTAGKGLQSLITALPFILSRFPDTHLLIIGAGSYREVLEGLYFALKTSNKLVLLELCKKGMDLDRNSLKGPWEDVQHFLNEPLHLREILKKGKLLDKHVHFLGRLDHSRLKYIFPCADLSVFPSIIPEAYPLVLMESLSNGVLPIVSYFSGFKDGVDELELFLDQKIVEKMKISINPKTRIDSIISNITSLLAETDLKQYTSTLRQIAVEHYDWKIRAKQLVQAYSSIIRD